MNLILLEADEVRAGGDVRLTGPRAAHLLNVLTVAAGDAVRIGIVDGPRGVGQVRAVEDGAVELGCTFEAAAPPVPAIDLLLALPRPKVLRRLWAQIAAIGVGQIVLTNAERVERNYFDTHVLTPECYRPLFIEGLQQARDTRMPAVSVHRQFRKLVEDDLDSLFPSGLRLVADPSATQSAQAGVRTRGADRILVAIGPEGGWNAFELDLLAGRGFHAVGMGPRTLRTDTACIALLTLVHAARG